MGNKAVFIDRDGTLVEEVDHLSKIEDLKVFPFTDEAIRRLKQRGYLVVVVSNQSGIGRRLFEESAVHAIHKDMQRLLDGQLDGLYFCPHIPDEGCDCRKPALGMIEAAVADLDIDTDRSWIVGDKKLDMETGFNARLSTAMVLTGYGSREVARLDRKPDIVAANLLEAVRQILGSGEGDS